MKKFIVKTKNNMNVYIGEKTLQHMEAHPDVLICHIKEALEKVSLEGTFFMESIEMKRTVGKDHCVYVSPENWGNIKMIQRPNRNGPTPMIKSEPSDTSLITIGACIDDDGLWTLFTAFYGVKAPKEPWDKNLTDEEREESKKFWKCHAICI